MRQCAWAVNLCRMERLASRQRWNAKYIPYPSVARKPGMPTISAVMRVALLTLASGMYLFNRLAGGNPAALLATPMGLAFALGAASSLIAFLLGIIVMRPAMVRAQRLAEGGGPAPEIQRLQRRGAMAGRVVAILLLFTLGAMAVARYL